VKQKERITKYADRTNHKTISNTLGEDEIKVAIKNANKERKSMTTLTRTSYNAIKAMLPSNSNFAMFTKYKTPRALWKSSMKESIYLGDLVGFMYTPITKNSPQSVIKLKRIYFYRTGFQYKGFFLLIPPSFPKRSISGISSCHPFIQGLNKCKL